MNEPMVAIDSIPDGGAREWSPKTEEFDGSVVLLREGDRVYAYRNCCPHARRLLNWAPGRFLFDHGRLVCAAHGAVFRIQDGLCLDGPCRGSSLAPVPVHDLGDGYVRIGD